MLQLKYQYILHRLRSPRVVAGEPHGDINLEPSPSLPLAPEPRLLPGVLPTPSHNVAPPTHESARPNSRIEDETRSIGWVPLTPQDMMDKRYKRHYVIPTQYSDSHQSTLKALTMQYARLEDLTSESCMRSFEWKPHESPEGNLYFHDIRNNVFTFADLYDGNSLTGITECAADLLQRISKQEDPVVASDTEIVITLEDHDDELDYKYVYGYYLATCQWKQRRVFWLDDVQYEYVTNDMRICLTESHIGKRVEYLFWLHVEMFPCHRTPPSDVVAQMIKILNLGAFDHITSDSSIFPYEKDEASEIIKCLERVQGSAHDANDMWLVARCKQNLDEYKFINYHGERGARIHRFDSVRKNTIQVERSILFQIITPILFFMPSVYMHEIEGVWIDDSVDWFSWRKFITLLDKDWTQSMTPATVILSANVGFLAIGSIDNVGGSHARSAAQVASYVSSVLSFFFFITVQVLTHHHRSSQYFTAKRASEFLKRRSMQWFGLQSVALTYSLPTALFIWSMLTFLAALMIVFFSKTNRATQVVMGVTVTTLLVATAILLYLDWDNHAWTQERFNMEPSREMLLLRLVRRFGLKSMVFSIRRKWSEKSFLRLKRRDASGNTARNKSSDSVASEPPTVSSNSSLTVVDEAASELLATS